MVHAQLPRELTTSMERVHVQDVYDQIAPHFSDLKQKAWPKVKQFFKSLEPGCLVADVGCGNGRYLNINSSVYKIGSDVCQQFVQYANQQGHEVMAADNLHLPYRDGVFDAVVSIGVIHHFSTHRHRLQALKELARILSPGGKLMVYVWAFEQKHRRFESQDVLIPWHKPSCPSQRLYRGSCSDLDRSSTSSVSDDETSSLGSFSQAQDSPPSDASLPLRYQSTEDFSQEDVFEVEEEKVGIQNGRPNGQQTVVQECRRLEACLKQLSEKQLSSTEIISSKKGKSVFPSPKFNYRKKSVAEVKTTPVKMNPFNDKKKVSETIIKPNYLPVQSPLTQRNCKGHLPTCKGHRDNCVFSKAEKSPAKFGLFQKLRTGLHELLSFSEDKKIQNGEADNHKLAPIVSPEDVQDFAVREFPMSSLPQPTEIGKPELQNGVHLGMKRNMSDLPNSNSSRNGGMEKIRSSSVKSLPLELASVDPEHNLASHKHRIRSISNGQDTDGAKAKFLPNDKHKKHEQNGLNQRTWGSQGSLVPGKSKRLLKKQHAVSQDFISDKCRDSVTLTSQAKGGKRVALDSSTTDSFHSSVSSTGTPTNTDLCRYYHVFKEGELCDIVQQNIEDLHIVDTYYDHANWCLIAEKVNI